MNVLHVSPSYFPATYWGGPVHSVYSLNNALARMPGMSLKVLTTDSAGPETDQRVDRSGLSGLYPNQEVAMTRRIAMASVSPGLLMELPRLVRWADVVHLTATYSFPTIPTLFWCRILQKPLVWSYRGAVLEVYEWSGAPRKRLKRLMEILCGALVRPGEVVAHVTSAREKEAAEARIPRAGAVVIPNGVEIPEGPQERVWMPAGRLRLLYLGRIAPKKGIENLLRALKALNDPSVNLTVCGTGASDYVARVQNLAAKLDFSTGTVAFVGQVDGADKRRAFWKADVCVVPSFTENFCMVVAEALAHGVPVIASRGTPWSVVEERQCGLWVDNGVGSLCDAITRIRALPLEEMGKRGRDWMEREFSWSAIAVQMASLYESCLMRNGGPARRASRGP